MRGENYVTADVLKHLASGIVTGDKILGLESN